MSDSYLNDEILAIVGEKTAPVTGLVTGKDIQNFCAAIDETNPLYLDKKAAQAAGYADVISPPLFNAATTRPAPHRHHLLADGQYDHVAPPGLGHLQTMLAGQSWEIIRPTVAGEELVEVFTTKSITERQGATGNIVFVEKEATLTTVQGELVERYSNTLILRKPPPPIPPFEAKGLVSTAAKAPQTTVLTEEGFIKHPDMICLFMFSAVIWALHRIHWDTPYAQSEGLPLPIVPGWMLSSYLAQLAEQRAPQGGRLHKIAVRYMGVVHPGDAVSCIARPVAADGGQSFAMVNQHGGEVARAQVAYAVR